LGTSRQSVDNESTHDFLISYIKWTFEFEIDIGKALEHIELTRYTTSMNDYDTEQQENSNMKTYYLLMAHLYMKNLSMDQYWQENEPNSFLGIISVPTTLF
jgi:hypothetical protein